MHKVILLIALSSWFSLHVGAAVLSETEKKLPATPLFNGKDLSGWKIVGGDGQFKVEDGCIVGFGQNIKGNTFLRSEKTFSDFIFSYQFKFDDRSGNSGMMFRANQKPAEDGNGRVFGYQCEADNKDRSWTAGIYDEARRGWLFPTKSKQADKAALAKNFTAQGQKLFKWDDWNTIVIKCRGNRIQTYLNGELRADFTDTDEKNDTRRGFFGLQVHGGKSCNVRWRDLTLRNLSTSDPLQPQQNGWIDLLKDAQLSQWKGIENDAIPASWKLENGILHFAKIKGHRGPLVTREKYKNFEMSFEWKISEAGNSGVKYRTDGHLGLEYQILDDEKHRDRKIKSHRAGSLYDILAAPDEKPYKKPGEWNTGRIIARDKLLQHWLNGTKVMEITMESEQWNTLFTKSKYRKNKNFGATDGTIYLQDHDDEVWYRSLKIKTL